MASEWFPKPSFFYTLARYVNSSSQGTKQSNLYRFKTASQARSDGTFISTMLKSAIRKQALQQRTALSESEFLTLNQQLLLQFKTLDFIGVKSIHVFLPIVKKHEPNTFLLIDWLQQHHPQVQLVVSKSNFKDCSMTHHPYLGKADLQENYYGIPEPQTTAIFEREIDMVLVPLLAFDKRGYRVGYGKGFYDRFLFGRRVQKIGISLLEPIENIEDVHKDDIRLDFCITPQQIYSFA